VIIEGASDSAMNEESKNSDDFEHACDVLEREDYKTAYKLFLSLANKDDADAQFILGNMFEDGLGVK
jgi:TPR repeat protein